MTESRTPICDLIRILFDLGFDQKTIFMIARIVERKIHDANERRAHWREYDRLKKRLLRASLPPGRSWESVRREVFDRDDYVCQHCGLRVDNPHCDHKVALVAGCQSIP